MGREDIALDPRETAVPLAQAPAFWRLCLTELSLTALLAGAGGVALLAWLAIWAVI